MSVCFFNSLLNGIHSNVLIVVTCYNSPFSSKTSSFVKTSYLPKFLDDKTEILAVRLSKRY